MAHGHEEHHGHGAHHGPKTLPASLLAPEVVGAWRTRALLVAAVAAVISLVFLFGGGLDHVLRGYLLGTWLAFSVAGGALCLLMLQYVSGGKWGLLLRRPLEAMSRTLWLPLVMLLPLTLVPSLGGRLYQWVKYSSVEATESALHSKTITEAQAHALNFKRPMLSPSSVTVQLVVIAVIFLIFVALLNKWSLQRDADPEKGTQGSYDRWRIKFENLSGIGVLIYVILMTVLAIDFVMALDVTWYSSVWGLLFLVGQGYIVLALAVHTVIRLSAYEPMATILRKTEQYDLGKFMLGFVMLNIYLSFAQFLIIWSGNLPEEIPWYLNRIRGGWWVICTCDFIFHWVIPFCLLLSRDLKRSKSKMLALTGWMIFARAFDLFWLIEPNFDDAKANLHLSGNISILAYITVPVAIFAAWLALYFTQLKNRPVVVENDPHTEEILEPEHAH